MGTDDNADAMMRCIRNLIKAAAMLSPPVSISGDIRNLVERIIPEADYED